MEEINDCGPFSGMVSQWSYVVKSMKPKYEVKDSGERQEYPSGMVRDTQDGKPRYCLVDRSMLTRWAAHMTKGAVKYGKENWRLAEGEEELDRFKESAFRHLVQWLDGEDDEDHAAAVFFNVAAAEMVKEKLKEKTKT